MILCIFEHMCKYNINALACQGALWKASEAQFLFAPKNRINDEAQNEGPYPLMSPMFNGGIMTGCEPFMLLSRSASLMIERF